MATKKTIKRTATAAKTAPVAAAPACNAGMGCGCSCHCSFFKKLIILGLVFAAGFATCHYMCERHGFRNDMRPIPEDMFVDGCLDTAKLQNDRMAQRIVTADKDGDGCITMEEMNAHRDEMRGNPDMAGKPMMRR